MAEYRIVCTEKQSATDPSRHEHIVAVGTGDDPHGASARWTVDQVIDAMIKNGARFYTVSPSTRKEADVEPIHCLHCTFQLIRTDPDQVMGNNLDELRPCSWRT